MNLRVYKRSSIYSCRGQLRNRQWHCTNIRKNMNINKYSTSQRLKFWLRKWLPVNKIWLPNLISGRHQSMCYEVFFLYMNNIKKQLFNQFVGKLYSKAEWNTWLPRYFKALQLLYYSFSVATRVTFGWKFDRIWCPVNFNQCTENSKFFCKIRFLINIKHI